MIPFSKRTTRYKPFTLAEVLMKDDTHEYWWVDSDTSEVVDKQEMKYYEHKIQLIEITKILERYPMSNRTFVQLSTGTQLTAEDVIDIIIDTVPFRDTLHVVSGRVIDSVDATLRTKASNVIVPDQYLTGRTMKEAFIEILKLAGINGYPRLIRDINGNFILTADYYNELVELVDMDEDNYFKQEVQSSSKYASSLNITGSNQIYSFNKNGSYVVEPSPSGWLSARSDTNLLNTDDAFIETKDEIDVRIKVMANISFSASEQSPTTLPFDITERVLEEEVRSGLEPLSPDGLIIAQENTIQYKRGAKNITNLYDVLDDRFLAKNFPNIELLYLAVLFENGFFSAVITSDSLAPENIEIRPYYTAKIDTIQEIDRADLTDISTTSTLIIGQGDSFIASDRVLDATFSKANRLGNKDVTTKAFPIFDKNDIWEKGSYTAEGFILTDVESVAYAEHFEALYHWTKDWQKVSDFLGLNSEPKLYEVQSTLVRNEIIKQYIILDTVSKPNTSYVNLLGVRVFANTFNRFPAPAFDKPIYAVAFQSTEIPDQILRNEALARPVVSYAGGNTMAFWFGFDNFKNAGTQLIFDDDGNDIRRYNKNVEYTDTEAQLIDFQVKYVNDYVSDPNLLPVITEPLSVDALIDTEAFRTYKNQSEILAMTLQLMVLPSQERVQDFVVGDYLTKNNNLINFKDGFFDDKVIWVDNTRYNLSDNKQAKGQDLGQVYTSGFTTDDQPYIELNSPIGTSGTPLNWALGDEQGNLYGAVNQIKYNGDFENINKVIYNFVDTRY